MPKPKYIDKTELKNRVKAGIKARIADGRMADPSKPQAKRDPRGASFTKAQRKEVVQRIELAIYDLANEQWVDWWDQLRELAKLYTAGNFKPAVFEHTCKEIEHAAVEAAQNPDLYARAQIAIGRMKRRVISIPGQKPGLATSEAANDSPILPSDHIEPTR